MNKKIDKTHLVGLMIGVLVGATQSIALLSNENQINIPESIGAIHFAFGLLGPMVLALITKLIKSDLSLIQSINNRVNVIFLISSMGIVTGILGGSYYLLLDAPSVSLLPFVFLGTSGIGFIVASLINPELIKKTKQVT